MNMKIELRENPKRIQKLIKPHLYYYQASDSTISGYNRCITVFGLERKSFAPHWLGTIYVNTASYYGDRPTANIILHKLFGYNYVKGRAVLDLRNKKIRLYNV